MNARTLAFLASTAVAAALLSTSATAQDMPKRKSGLWEITMENSAAKGTPAAKMTMTQCVDAAKDDMSRQMGQQMDKDHQCKMGRMQQAAGRITMEASCDMGGSKMTSVTTITGDFNSAYRTEIKSKFNPPMMGMSEGTTVMDAKYVGACKPGMRPGDVAMPGGMTMNMYDMMEGAAKKK